VNLEPDVFLAEPLALPAGRRTAPPRFLVHRAADRRHGAARAAVEDFIRDVYARHYGATLRQFKPTLVSLEDDGVIAAAAGFQAAGDGVPLFLEHYLDVPVEQAIARHAGTPVARAAIAEVGQFGSMQPGQGRRLMAHLGRQLAADGFQWVVSTATRELRVIFERLRIRPLVLGRADPRVLGAAAADWGTYYEHAPLVLAGEVRSNLARFAPLP
jgi:Thermostable hemolysin